MIRSDPADIKSFSQRMGEHAGKFVTEFLSGILILFLNDISQDNLPSPIKHQGSESLLTGYEVAERLNISKGKAYKLMSSGKIDSIRFDKTIRVREHDLDKFINDHIAYTT